MKPEGAKVEGKPQASEAWKVRDHLWTNGDYDAHLTGTVCRKFRLGDLPEIDYMGPDWDNTYNVYYWYEVMKGDDVVKREALNANLEPLPAKVGSKIAAQMLIFRKPMIMDPCPDKLSYSGAAALLSSWTLLAGAYLLF